MTKKILLVDDTATVLMFEKMMLANNGYEITTAANGIQALASVEQSPPDLILLDIVMPHMDGIETCQRLKENPDTKDIPILMVTTKGESEKVDAAFKAGCNDYLTKPVDKMQLMVKVRTYLG